jgi:ribosomal protein L29
MHFDEIKNKNDKDLLELLQEERSNLQQLRFKAHGKSLKSAHEIKNKRKLIAQILTVQAMKAKPAAKKVATKAVVKSEPDKEVK